ncbi:hypothetical protein ACFUJR_27895 [Streptomyces sp. NPDC057271]|uniref:hypothetical protein n=1 Tax=unclassified Streptomyces TaxID=2593676 RepID=UPI003635FF23
MATHADDFCTNLKCGGHRGACGCPDDIHTQDLMTCPACDGKWWRPYGSTSTRCLHPACSQDGSTVSTPARYRPALDENGQPVDTAEPGDEDDCHAELIDGSWTNCGCDGCEEREAEYSDQYEYESEMYR